MGSVGARKTTTTFEQLTTSFPSSFESREAMLNTLRDMGYNIVKDSGEYVTFKRGNEEDEHVLRYGGRRNGPISILGILG